MCWLASCVSSLKDGLCGTSGSGFLTTVVVVVAAAVTTTQGTEHLTRIQAPFEFRLHRDQRRSHEIPSVV